MRQSLSLKKLIEIGDRVYVKPYSCLGIVTKVEWQEELKLTDDLTILPGYVYWVELEGRDLKPRGFNIKSLKLIC